MAKVARSWTQLDKTLVEKLRQARSESAEPLSYRKMSQQTGISTSRLSGIFLETMGPPTISEVAALCDLFGLSMPKMLEEALRREVKPTAV